MPDEDPPPYKLIDRNPQNLPMPVGGFRVVRKDRRPSGLIKFWHRNAATIFASVGLLAALVGGYLAINQQPFPVYLQGGNIHVAGNVLTPQTSAAGSGQLYVGGGAMVVKAAAGGGITASASTFSHGSIVTGRCVMTSTPAQVLENCSFKIGSSAVTATDTYDLTASGDHVWHRHYSDGTDVSIGVPPDGAMVPVPFAVGR